MPTCRMALRVAADAICEKPVVINPWNLDSLQELEAETVATYTPFCSFGYTRLYLRCAS